MAAHDILFADPEKGPQLRQHARESGVHAASDLAELCREADIVISAVTADAAVAVAGQAAPHLTSSQTYIDLNSISPATKEQAAEQVRQRGAEFVDMRPIYAEQADQELWVEDGIHPTPEAYQVWAEELASALPAPCT